MGSFVWYLLKISYLFSNNCITIGVYSCILNCFRIFLCIQFGATKCQQASNQIKVLNIMWFHIDLSCWKSTLALELWLLWSQVYQIYWDCLHMLPHVITNSRSCIILQHEMCEYFELFPIYSLLRSNKSWCLRTLDHNC